MPERSIKAVHCTPLCLPPGDRQVKQLFLVAWIAGVSTTRRKANFRLWQRNGVESKALPCIR